MIEPIQASVPNTAVKLADIPPGANSVTITVAAANTTFVYVGLTSGVTTANGAPIPGGSSVDLAGFSASKGTTLWGIGSVAGPTPVGIFISTAS